MAPNVPVAGRMMQSVLLDLRYAFRMLAKSPGFSIVAVLVLALGIGANTAIFSVINSLLLRPLPFHDSDRLALIWETNAKQGISREGPSGSNFLDWKAQSHSFKDMAALEIGTGTVTGFGEPEQVPALRVSTNLLTMLGARPALGRVFTPEDGKGGRQNIAVLSYGFWKSHYGANPGVIGKTVMLDLLPYTVIGVTAAGFWEPVPSDVFVPWPDQELKGKARLAHDLGVIGLLQPGVTADQAQAELNTIADGIRRSSPELAGWGVTVVPMQKALVQSIKPALLVLFGAVAFVLLIACTNVANLLLARAAGRRREVAVRVALGAGHLRLARQFLAESLVLGLLGGGLGLLFALWGVAVIGAALPGNIPLADADASVLLARTSVDGRVLLFSMAVSVLTGILFGLAPALHALKTDVHEGLKQGARGSDGDTHAIRRALLIAEVAGALVLMVGASLMLKSFSRLESADIGFRADHLLTMEMELPTDSRYQKPPEQSAFFQQVLEKISVLPGVHSAAVTAILPLTQQDQRARFLIENGPPLPQGQRLAADYRRVSPSFFQTLGVPLLRGRLLEEHDGPDAPSVAVIDETMARRWWPNENPVGRRLVTGMGPIEIVGVVGAVKHAGLEKDARPTVYVSYRQHAADRMSLVIRTVQDPNSLAKGAKHAIWSVDHDQAIYRVESMDEVVSAAGATPRVTVVLLASFAVTALLLATLGIYGVMAYLVSQRTREIGIRVALGAGGADVLRLVVGQGLSMTAVGVAVGLAAAAVLTRFLSALLYEVSAIDPAIFAAMAVLVSLVAMAASYLPARRAATVDPVVVLREE